MSDFDKEAEREKLREKYEQEKQKREATEQMSELLLQGATMTNAHCSDCGDPIFRYDGQEFCPTCEKAVDRETGNGAAEDDGDEDPAPGGIEVTEPDETRVKFGGSPDSETTAPEGSQAGETPAGEPPESPESVDRASPDAQERDRDTAEETRRERPTAGEARRERRARPRAAGETSLEAARESLVRTIVRFSDRAEATDDPRRAQDYLAAVREAAEALSALDS